MSDLISRQAAINAFLTELTKRERKNLLHTWSTVEVKYFITDMLEQLPSVQPEKRTEERAETHACDCISRQDAIDALEWKWAGKAAMDAIKNLPSAQPERICLNCGRTVNNGGWYADGRTRCPIEEHYALPKDGYCHLWEKRNVTDDGYCFMAERREEGDK